MSFKDDAIGFFDSAASAIAEKVLTVEPMENQKIVDERMSICTSNVNVCYDSKRDKCYYCNCYMEVKTKTKTHRDPKTGKVVTTVCPRGLW